MRRYKSAVRERNIQVEGHRGFTSNLPVKLVEGWEEMCQMWERAPHPKKVPNPYDTEEICQSSPRFLETYSLFRVL
jgi:hypothetical protein